MQGDPQIPHTLTDVLVDVARRSDEDRRAAFVMAISALSLLVDSGLVTAEQAAARLGQVHETLPESLRTERLAQHVALAQRWLGVAPDQAAPDPASAARPGWTPEVIAGGRPVGTDQDAGVD